MLSFCFLLAGAQSGTTNIMADPQEPIEGENVTLTPATVPANSISCRWYQGTDPGKNLILIYYLPPLTWQTTGPGFTGRETGNSDCSLRITDLKTSDSGVYTLEMERPGALEMGTADIVVSEVVSKPTLSISSNPFPREHKDSLQLTCNTRATRANVIWLLNGKPVGSSSRIQFSNHNRTLAIQQVLRRDDGNYQCQVFNKMSDGLYVPVIYGPDPPAIVPSKNAYYEHSDIKLFCVADAFPGVRYTWFFNGKSCGSGAELALRDVSRAQSGNYTCQAINLLSRNTASAALEILVACE
ncbi:carcinoembryonic antigen-related cell adhesion molecule 6-like [Sceloporus undulatus]|uniref:carcinoembryonic antigen-related cell adhesion molecule 6-like n=1 Tax=Sceloporus undulatus TaxID=8520 RepID=UPI001C4C5025|nr:carcinoembryonic antigen-related cell adhesion molecule 6-like [Sceloporus undulatus]